jgi:hypothetical protein
LNIFSVVTDLDTDFIPASFMSPDAPVTIGILGKQTTPKVQ